MNVTRDSNNVVIVVDLGGSGHKRMCFWINSLHADNGRTWVQGGGSCLGLLSVLIGGIRRWQPDIRAVGHMFHIERQGDTWFAEGTIRFHTTVDKH